MRLAILTLALLTGASAMAVETNYKPAPAPTGGPTSDIEALLKSERGQALQGVVDLIKKGDKEGAEKALEAYRRMYNQPSASDQAQGNPVSRPPQRATNPMQLPPEAR